MDFTLHGICLLFYGKGYFLHGAYEIELRSETESFDRSAEKSIPIQKR